MDGVSNTIDTFICAKDRNSASNNSDCNSNFLRRMLKAVKVPSPLKK